ncbi:Uncharacterised protein [Mycobacterium tuberculosis]|uniref:Uncharacterized protein n=1 Tax=Mycobacterium tuberculosis TaxID=1773 RepID=A0A655A8S8_MYCTX|nr:Uncharacterised protein [Mycobacterium tuberculosis]CKS57201.1 Uncharacterised protein [Mycobacterium tuberculosis]CNM57111.1 Uncharacterised protein [Mycobacterium tuberculosis]CNM91188.1 Uncharacterised protein [Mycobacterium tuberculosis]CNV22150.1 Uncharacterised protein [Mycobacterium tuberculosis]
MLADHAVVTAHGHVGEHGGASGRAGFAQRVFAEQQGAAATGFGERVTLHDLDVLGGIDLDQGLRHGRATGDEVAEVGRVEFGELGHLAHEVEDRRHGATDTDPLLDDQ